MVLGTRGGFFLAHRSRGFRRDQPIIIIKRDFDRNWKLCALEKPLAHRVDREEKKEEVKKPKYWNAAGYGGYKLCVA